MRHSPRLKDSRIVAAALLVLAALAPPALAFPVIVGLSGGSTVPNLHAGDDNPISNGWSSRFAPAFGLFAEIPFTAVWSLRTGLDYAPQGAKRDGMQPVPGDYSGLGLPPGAFLYANFKNLQKLDYLEIPLLARMRFGAARRVFVEAGPYAGFLLSAKNQTRGTSSFYYDAAGTQPVTAPEDFNSNSDVHGDLHAFNWGLEGGLGFAHPVGPGALQLEARGGYGLAVVQKDTRINGKNNTGDLAIAIGYAIPLRSPR